MVSLTLNVTLNFRVEKRVFNFVIKCKRHVCAVILAVASKRNFSYVLFLLCVANLFLAVIVEVENETTENQSNSDEDASNQNEPTNENDGAGSQGDQEEPSDIEMDLLAKPKKKRKKGIIYGSNIPKHMNITRIREILGNYGKIGRVFLQPEKMSVTEKQKKRKRLSRHFTEGWVEFESKRAAKQIVEFLNNKQISTRKKSQSYDSLWSMKYLPRFKWVHLTERMNYEQAVHKQRLMTEVSQARKETSFFQNNLDKSLSKRFFSQ